MRWALVRVVLAATSMVAIAFVVPLGLVAKQIAEDRALSDARHQAGSAVIALAVSSDRSTLADVLDRATSDRVAIHVPGQPAQGELRADEDDIELVRQREEAAVVQAAGGQAYLEAATMTDDQVAVIEVYVPASELWRGVVTAWLAMAGLAVALVVVSVALADRLGTRLVAAARELARGARALGGQDLAARVQPAGPPELTEVGEAFNAMAGKLADLVTAERERAADLSHRLRTPLTALRLDADALPPGEAADRIHEAVNALDAEIDEIIASARLPHRDAPPEPTDLVDVLAARLAFWTVLADHQERPWEVRGSDQPVWLDVPRADLTAAIDALMGNVFRHTPSGTAFVVTITQDALVIEDAGAGIADEEAALSRGVSGADSTGLGLDIVQWVAARAGGTVELSRSSLGGALVRVALRPDDVLDSPAGGSAPDLEHSASQL